MTSEGLGEMFEGDSADMCARKFPLWKRGPPSAIIYFDIYILILNFDDKIETK